MSNEQRAEISSSCDQTFDAENHEITSPNFPKNYPNDKYCTWNIDAPHGHLIELDIIELSIESNGDKCNYDWLEFHDIGDQKVLKESGAQSRFCSNNHPNKIVSTTNRVKLEFKTDNVQTRTGFKIRYSINGR